MLLISRSHSNENDKYDLSNTLTVACSRGMLRLVIERIILHHRIVLILAAVVLLVRTDASGNPSTALRSQSLSFALECETNSGQFAPEMLYLARSSTHFVYLTRSGMTLGFTGAPQRGAAIRIALAGAQQRASITGEARVAGVSNYLIG